MLLAGCAGIGDDGDSPLPGEGEDDRIIERRLTPVDRNASEVTVAADPTDPTHVVAGANSNGPQGAGFDLYESEDAGDTWDAGLYQADEIREPTEGPTYEAISDPVLEFASDGTLYLSGLALIPGSAIFVAVSPDGDVDFEDTYVVDESDPLANFNDKEWLGVSPETGTLIVAWQKEPAVDQLRGVEARTGIDADVGRIVSSRSTDDGETWSDPAEVSRGMHSNGTQVAFTEGGTAHMIWTNYETDTIDYVRSTDDGETWTDPEPIGPVDTVDAYPRYQRMHTLPALASDEDGQALYAVYHDESTGDADVLAVASGDAGRSWSQPVRVNDDLASSGAIQFYPWATVGPAGDVHVSWYDSRIDPETPTFEFYHASAPGPGLNFTPNHPVSNATFTPFANSTDATGDDAGSVTLGDYTGIAASEAGVFPGWADARNGSAKVYAARLPLAAR